MSVLDNALQTLLGLSNKVDLLWENASPGSEFPAQTLNLNVAVYDYVAVISRYRAITFFGVGSYNAGLYEITGNVSNTARIYRRGVTVNDASIRFDDTYVISNLGNSNGEKNNSTLFTRPLAIYGIKSLGGGA